MPHNHHHMPDLMHQVVSGVHSDKVVVMVFEFLEQQQSCHHQGVEEHALGSIPKVVDEACVSAKTHR